MNRREKKKINSSGMNEQGTQKKSNESLASLFSSSVSASWPNYFFSLQFSLLFSFFFFSCAFHIIIKNHTVSLFRDNAVFLDHFCCASAGEETILVDVQQLMTNMGKTTLHSIPLSFL